VPPASSTSDALPPDAGGDAVRHARACAAAALRRGRVPPAPAHPALAAPRGAFVALWAEAAGLRGCVGFPQARDPLREVLAQAAQGAVRDPRFDPVRPSELDALRVEVSVLTPPRPLAVRDPALLPEALRVGTDGLVLQAGRHRALLLPQVALEHGMTAAQFLAACCAKAGLDEEAWRRRDGLRWSTFQAQVFEEAEPSGAVVARGQDRPEVT
jgi:uncharacterized protein